MKTLLLSILTLGIVTTGSCLFKTEPASAYCDYNKSDDSSTAIQLTVKPDFKKVINPHPKECCHWTDDSCTEKNEGRYGKTPFAIFDHPEDVNESEQNYHTISRNSRRKKKWISRPSRPSRPSPYPSYASK